MIEFYINVGNYIVFENTVEVNFNDIDFSSWGETLSNPADIIRCTSTLILTYENI